MSAESSPVIGDDVALRAIAHPARRTMLRLVWSTERTSTELADLAGVSRPAASQHLRVLRNADLVDLRVDGNRRWYRTDHATVARIRALVESFWNSRIDTLVAEAEAEAARRG